MAFVRWLIPATQHLNRSLFICPPSNDAPSLPVESLNSHSSYPVPHSCVIKSQILSIRFLNTFNACCYFWASCINHAFSWKDFVTLISPISYSSTSILQLGTIPVRFLLLWWVTDSSNFGQKTLFSSFRLPSIIEGNQARSYKQKPQWSVVYWLTSCKNQNPEG